MNNELSVIVTCYNKEREIRRCLFSLLDQKDKNFELIVIDDGSTDNTVDIVKEFFNENKTSIHIKTIFQKNQGSIKTRLNGVRIATGEFITFIDGDDFVDGNYIGVIRESIRKNSESDLFLFNNKINLDDKNFVNEKKLKYCSNLPLNVMYKWVLTGKAGAVWDKIYKKELFNTNLDLKIFYGDDVWLNIVYLRKTKYITVIDKAVYYHVKSSASSGSTQSFPLSRLDEIDNLYVFVKNEKEMTTNIGEELFNEFTIMYLINTTIIVEHIYGEKVLRESYIRKFNNLKIVQEGLKNVRPKIIRHKIYIFFIRHRSFWFFYLKLKLKALLGLGNE